MNEGDVISINRLRAKALANQNAVEYTRLSDVLGLTEHEDPFLYERGILESSSGSGLEVRTNRDETPKLTKPDKLRQLADEYRVNPDNIFTSISQKRDILVQAGYKNAYVSKGRKIPLRDASDERIGAMFKRIYCN